ncbi:hypothetical protein ACN28S_27445 [Cystobacter fuscus]
MLVKGLPGGYNRDLQEDRQVLLETGPLLTSVLSMLHRRWARCTSTRTSARRRWSRTTCRPRTSPRRWR